MTMARTRVRFPYCSGCGRFRERQAGFSCCRACAYALAARLSLTPTVGDGVYMNRMLTTGTPAPAYDGPPRVRKAR